MEAEKLILTCIITGDSGYAYCVHVCVCVLCCVCVWGVGRGLQCHALGGQLLAYHNGGLHLISVQSTWNL
jgi:hypothetical protein